MEGGIVYSANTGDIDNNCNYVYLNDATVNTVYVDKGSTYIYANGRFCDVIVSDSNNETFITSVDNVDEALGVKIEKQDQTVNRYTPMFSHYDGKFTINISSYDNSTKQITDENVAIIGSYTGDVFSLNSDEFNYKFNVLVGGGDSSGAYLKLEGMSQLVDMNDDAIETYNSKKEYTLGSDILANAKDVYVQGTESSDVYEWYSDLSKQYTINDKGGNDILAIYRTNDTFRFFFDIDTTGKIIGNDLYVLSYDSSEANAFNAFFSVKGAYDGNYIKIENFFNGNGTNAVNHGNGYIEEIVDVSGNTLSGDYLFGEIVEQVSNWLSTNTSYSSVSDMFSDSNLENGATQLYNLAGQFANSSNWNNTFSWNSGTPLIS